MLEPLTNAGVPYTGDQETDEILNDIPDILERIHRHEEGADEGKLIPLEDIMARLTSGEGAAAGHS